jgi:CheY-like chemotaxis protein
MNLTRSFLLTTISKIDALINRKVIHYIAPEAIVHNFNNGQTTLNTLIQMLNSDTDEYPQLILLDLFMPGMNGWQFLEHYKQLVQDKKVTCIIYMITNSHDIDDWVKAREHKLIENVILKPFAHQSFFQILNKHFNK